jgi:TolA-binding protein
VLDAYLDDAPSGSSAGLAAFLLGRIAQDSLHDPERAAAAFARTMQLGSPRAVLPEALARRARALADAGRLDQAADLARRYLERHPSGAAAAAMRRLVERASGAP